MVHVDPHERRSGAMREVGRWLLFRSTPSRTTPQPEVQFCWCSSEQKLPDVPVDCRGD